MKNSFLLVCLLTILAGCATTGHPFNMNATEQIKVGASTKEDVVALLGDPSSVSTKGDGHVVMNYNYVHVETGSRKSQSFTVTIAPDGKVVSTYKHTANQ